MFNKRKISIILIAVAVIGVGLYWRQPLARATMRLLEVAQGVIRVRSSPKNGLVGYWNFDECDTCTTAADKSGNGNTGTMYDNVTAANLHTTSGKIGNGISLDGSNDYVNIGDTASVDFGAGDFTLTAWVKLASTNSRDAVMGKDVAGSRQFYLILNTDTAGNVQAGMVVFGIFVDGQIRIIQTTDAGLVDTGWHHVTAVRRAGPLEIFVDGIQRTVSGTQSSAGEVMDSATASLEIGRRTYGGGWEDPFHGQIDDARIYNRALSADEITRLYEEGSFRTTVNANQNSSFNNGLTGMWSFNGPDMDWASTTAEVLDKSGNGLNGDAINLTNKSVRSGIVGQAMNFSAANSEYVALASSPSGGNLHNGVYTIAAWAYPKSMNSTHLTIISDPWINNNVLSFFLGLDNNGSVAGVLGFVIGWFYGAWDGVGTDDSPLLYLNKWTHVVGTYDGATFKIYINGVLDNQKNVSRTGSNGVGSAEIGRYTGGSNLYWDGMLDEVRFYNRALNAAEIQELYLSSARL